MKKSLIPLFRGLMQKEKPNQEIAMIEKLEAKIGRDDGTRVYLAVMKFLAEHFSDIDEEESLKGLLVAAVIVHKCSTEADKLSFLALASGLYDFVGNPPNPMVRVWR